MNTGRSLLGDTLNSFKILRELVMNKGSEIATYSLTRLLTVGMNTIIQKHVRRLPVLETLQTLLNTPNIFLFSLSLPSKHRNSHSRDSCSSRILSREDVTRRPSYFSTKGNQRLNQTIQSVPIVFKEAIHGSLDGHVETSCDSGALQWLCRAVFLTKSHEAGHFFFPDFDFFSSKGSEANVCDFVFKSRSRHIERQKLALRN